MTRTAFRTCPLCEAGCGLELTIGPKPDGTGETVTRVRGDREDVFSKGFICPKGSTIQHLHEDPDRLRRPLVKRDGTHVEVTWDEAWQVVDEGFRRIVDAHGRDAIGVYIGNPNAHNIGASMLLGPLMRSIGSRSRFSASTVDQRPKEVAASMMFGGGLTVPVPDVDRTDFLLCLGANPYASNGSFATAPDWPGRIEAMLARGGELVVVDPRRSRTAEEATQWLAIRPGTDAYLLAAITHVLFAEELVDLGAAYGLVAGLDAVRDATAALSPEAVAEITGIDAPTIADLARRLAAAPTAVVYGRIGTTTQRFGTLTSWLVDVVNVLTGNFDRPGGAMFTKAAAGASNTRPARGTPKPVVIGRSRSRVSGLPESFGELPVNALAEEIDTAGDGQLRAMVTVAGNPVLSTPNSDRLDAALASLEFMVSVDIYLNETTRHADVILPAPSPLQKAHYDLALLQVALRNVANWSEPVLPLDEGQPDEWEVLARLSLAASGSDEQDPAVMDDMVWQGLADKLPTDVREAVEATGRRGPARMIDAQLRTGPYDVTLDDLLANPHGIDFGALEPRLGEGIVRTPSGLIELAPPLMLEDVPRLLDGLVEERSPFLLVGRRDLRSNNSWMHNIRQLVKGKPRCTMHLHPDDAAALSLRDGEPAVVASRVGSLTVPVEVTDAIAPGVVSIPHGWGHDLPGMRLGVAGEHAGVNSNRLADETLMDTPTGTSVLNGIPVTVTPA